MRPSICSGLVAVAALSSCAMGAVTVKISKNMQQAWKIGRRQQHATSVTESLLNDVTDGGYYAAVTVGTPPQNVTLVIDTGSSDTWVLDVSAEYCQEYPCQTPFNSSASSTFKRLDVGGFSIQYADNTASSGDSVSDTFTIGGASITALQMGLAYDVTLPSVNIPSGIMGIGYDTNEAMVNPYPNIIDDMVKQGLIATKAYSLYLDNLESSTGSIIFGALDSQKYHGSLVTLDIIPDTYHNGTQVFAEFTVGLKSLTITPQSGNPTTIPLNNSSLPVILDSGTTITYLPDAVAAETYKTLQAVDDTAGTGNVYVNCDLRTTSPKMTLDYGFGGVTIRVPIGELIFDVGGPFDITGGTSLPSLPFKNVCALGIQPAGLGGPNLFGDTFLRSAYVVYDLANNKIAMGQTNFNSTSSNIVEFVAGQTTIPNVTGVAGDVFGTTSNSKKSAAVASIPALDMASLAAMGIAGAFAVLWGC